MKSHKSYMTRRRNGPAPFAGVSGATNKQDVEEVEAAQIVNNFFKII
jgi:hypothetical protein